VKFSNTSIWDRVMNTDDALGESDELPVYGGLIDPILPFLFISGAQGGKDKEALHALQISHVVNVTTECKNYYEHDFGYLRCETLDEIDEDISQHFDVACDFVERAREEGCKVLVHCAAGRSRSASIVIAYLMKYEHMTLRRAYLHLKSRRPIVRPNLGFFRQLLRLERSLFGLESLTEHEFLTFDWRYARKKKKKQKKLSRKQKALERTHAVGS